jgi:hypothetical protein
MLGRVTQGDQGSMTLESMVFEPVNRVIYLAVGSDAPHQGYQRIDLRGYFSGDGGTDSALPQREPRVAE